MSARNRAKCTRGAHRLGGRLLRHATKCVRCCPTAVISGAPMRPGRGRGRGQDAAQLVLAGSSSY